MKEKQPVFHILPGCPKAVSAAVEIEAEAKVVDHPW